MGGGYELLGVTSEGEHQAAMAGKVRMQRLEEEKVRRTKERENAA